MDAAAIPAAEPLATYDDAIQSQRIMTASFEFEITGDFEALKAAVNEWTACERSRCPGTNAQEFYINDDKTKMYLLETFDDEDAQVQHKWVGSRRTAVCAELLLDRGAPPKA